MKIKVYFRVPRPRDLNFEAWLPAVPRIGETVEHAYEAFTVTRVVWYTNDEESPYLTSPYLTLEPGEAK